MLNEMKYILANSIGTFVFCQKNHFPVPNKNVIMLPFNGKGNAQSAAAGGDTSNQICEGLVPIFIKDAQGASKVVLRKTKFDTGGAVSLSHERNMLQEGIKDAREYGLPHITLSGIGGTTDVIRNAGKIKIRKPDNTVHEVIARH